MADSAVREALHDHGNGAPAQKEDRPRNKKGRPPKDTSLAVKAHRFQITLSEKGYQRLSVLQQATDAVSAADVIRDALRVYEALVKETIDGNHIVVEDADDKNNRVRLQLW